MMNASEPDDGDCHNYQLEEDHDYSGEEYLEELLEDYREPQAEPEAMEGHASVDKRSSLCLEISARAEMSNLVRHKTPA